MKGKSGKLNKKFIGIPWTNREIGLLHVCCSLHRIRQFCLTQTLWGGFSLDTKWMRTRTILSTHYQWLNGD